MEAIWGNTSTQYIGHKDHKCDSCGKSFSQQGHLKRHIHTVHEGRKDLKCESCDKSFTRATTLKQHVQAIHNAKNKIIE